MLHRASKMRGLPIAATDGEIGAVEDVYFDDERWGVRYLVVDTGGWLGGRRVLISPRSIPHGQWSESAIRVQLTRQQVEGSPPMETARPVSRLYEESFAAYYGHPGYWSGPYLWGVGAYPVGVGHSRSAEPGGEFARQEAAAEREAAESSHLRSTLEVTGYQIEARDGAIGHVEDLLVDDETWGIPYLVVDKRAWLPGGQVLITPDSVREIDWTTSSVRLSLTRDAVKNSPDYTG